MAESAMRLLDPRSAKAYCKSPFDLDNAITALFKCLNTHGMVNALTLSAQQCRHVATSDEASLPLPPAYSWSKSGPNVVISDSSVGFMRYSARQRGVAEFVSAVPTLKSERGWHGLYDGVVGRAELPTITRTLDDYTALCGAGYSDDGTVLVVPHDRAIVVFWCLNDVCGRRGGWEYKMEHLSDDVLRLARLSHFAGPVIFVIGGSARVWHLPVSFDTARNAVLKILRDAGCTAFSG